MLVGQAVPVTGQIRRTVHAFCKDVGGVGQHRMQPLETGRREELRSMENMIKLAVVDDDERTVRIGKTGSRAWIGRPKRSEEHTSELQSLMRISYAVFCLQKKTKHTLLNYKQ